MYFCIKCGKKMPFKQYKCKDCKPKPKESWGHQ